MAKPVFICHWIFDKLGFNTVMAHPLTFDDVMIMSHNQRKMPLNYPDCLRNISDISGIYCCGYHVISDIIYFIKISDLIKNMNVYIWYTYTIYHIHIVNKAYIMCSRFDINNIFSHFIIKITFDRQGYFASRVYESEVNYCALDFWRCYRKT